MNELPKKANLTLLRIYELTGGKLSRTVSPSQLRDGKASRPVTPENAHELVDALEPLGVLWYAQLIELTQNRMLLTESGKAHVEKLAVEIAENFQNDVPVESEGSDDIQ